MNDNIANFTSERKLGNKFFELSNHLGNVLSTVSDRKLGVEGTTTGIVDYYTADVKSSQDYYPFGMLMPGRGSGAENYRFGFNGMEMDDEVNNTMGGSYTAAFWQYDSRLGRRWNVDPVVKVHESSYASFSNNPIIMVDPKGDDDYFSPAGLYLGTDNRETNTIRIVHKMTVGKILYNHFYSKDKYTKQEFIKLVQENNTALIKYKQRDSKTLGNIGTHYNKNVLNSKYRCVTEIGGPAPGKAGVISNPKKHIGELEGAELGVHLGSSKKGYIYPQLNDKWDMVSIIVHENYHNDHHMIPSKEHPGFYKEKILELMKEMEL